MSLKNTVVAGLLAASLAPGAFAETAGSVLSVSGPEGAVVGMRANATFPVTAGATLQVGDLVLVGADASVSLAGPGGCQRTLESMQSLAVTPALCTGEPTSVASSTETALILPFLAGLGTVGSVLAVVAVVAVSAAVVNATQSSSP
jgi:hypothetical protein